MPKATTRRITLRIMSKVLRSIGFYSKSIRKMPGSTRHRPGASGKNSAA